MKFQLSSLLQPSALDDARTAEGLLALNQETQEYGLELSREDALALVETRRIALEASGRLEFGTPVLEKIIRTFSRSRYLYQYDYAPTLHELLEAFFLLRNETEDHFSDDDLIDFLFDCYEFRYHGSLEMFQGPELDRLCRLLLLGGDEEKNDWNEEDGDE